MAQDLKIKKILIREITKKLKNPLTNSITTIDYKNFLILEVHDESGVIGYGECVAFSEPWYTEETTQTCLYILKKFLIPLVKQHKPKKPDELKKVFSIVKRNHMAKAALECAIWDAYAKVNQVPLSILIGSRTNQVEAGISLGITSNPDELLKKIADSLQKGYKRVKLKIEPGWDIHILNTVREKFPNIPLMVDANGSYSIQDISHLQKFEKFQLEMFEQPFSSDRLLEHQCLVNKVKTPICLDESIDSYSNAKLAISLQSTEIITLKIGRVGGISESMKLIDLCQKNNVPIWIGGMFETGIGRAFNVIIASTFDHALPGDIGESSHYWYEDLIEEPFIINNGNIQVPTGLGIGVTVNKKRLKKHTTNTFIFNI